MEAFLVLLLVGLIILYILNCRTQILLGRQEEFNNRKSKEALYDNPETCPFDYITFREYDEDGSHKYVISTQIKGEKKPELDNYFDTVDEFQQQWGQTAAIFPNLNICGN